MKKLFKLILLILFLAYAGFGFAQSEQLNTKDPNYTNELNDLLHQLNDSIGKPVSVANIVGIVTPAQGGTGQDSSAWTSGDIPYMSSAGVWGHQPFTSFATLHGLQYFASSGTFTAPTGITKVFLTMIGGGGGGLDNAGAVANGPGGGASVISFPYTVVALSNYTVTVGSGGAHGASPADGGTTSFDSTISVTGGKKGGSTGAGGVGGYNSATSGGGTYRIAGGNGGTSGGGGGTPFGTGGSFIGSAAGSAATINSGAGGANGDTSFNGSDGAAGFVLVQY